MEEIKRHQRRGGDASPDLCNPDNRGKRMNTTGQRAVYDKLRGPPETRRRREDDEEEVPWLNLSSVTLNRREKSETVIAITTKKRLSLP